MLLQMNSNSLVIKQIYTYIEDQAKKICSLRKTGFHYSYFTARIRTNDLSVPSLYWKVNDCS